MFNGIGTDIIEICRMRNAIKKEHFLNRVFTQNEIEYAKTKKDMAETLAGIFCAKESVVKAFGVGFRGLKFHDIEVLHDKFGKPYFSDPKVMISISHCKDYATAVAIIKE